MAFARRHTGTMRPCSFLLFSNVGKIPDLHYSKAKLMNIHRSICLFICRDAQNEDMSYSSNTAHLLFITRVQLLLII